MPVRRTQQYPRLKVAYARRFLMDGDHGRAVAVATGPEHEYRSTPRDRVHLTLILASARLRSGDEKSAAQAFRDAVDLATRTGLRTPFAAMPRQDVSELASQVPGADGLLGEIEGFRPLFPEPENVVTLTKRELVVLRELATPDTIPVIAQRLGVASGTVKTQCRGVYGKLGVSDRHEAVAEARRRGIQ